MQRFLSARTVLLATLGSLLAPLPAWASPAPPQSPCPGILRYDPQDDITIQGSFTVEAGVVFGCPIAPMFMKSEFDTSGADVPLGDCGGFANAPVPLIQVDGDIDDDGDTAHAKAVAGGNALGFAGFATLNASMTWTARLEASGSDESCNDGPTGSGAAATFSGSNSVTIPFQVTEVGSYYLNAVLSASGCDTAQANGSWAVFGTNGQLVVSGSIGAAAHAEVGAIGPGSYVFTAHLQAGAVASVCTACGSSDDGSCTHQFHFSVNVAVARAIGDVDFDGVVGIIDLLDLLGSWGSCPGFPAECFADLDGDGVVGITDLLTLLANWSSPLHLGSGRFGLAQSGATRTLGSLAGTTDGFDFVDTALRRMGHPSVEHWRNWMLTATREQQQASVTRLLRALR